MTLVRTRSLTVSILVHAAIIVSIVFFPGFSLRKKPEPRIYTVNIVKEASIKKKPVPKPPPVKKKKKKPKPKKKPDKKPDKKPQPKKKLVKKNIFEDKKKEIEKKIKEREEKLEKKFVEPEEFMEQRKATVETKDFDFPWYGDIIASKVYGSWVQPSKVMVGDKPLQSVVAFRVFRDGRVAVLGIRSSSGKHLMDESATKAIEDAQPFPPFPREWQGESIDVTVTFDLAE